MLLPFSILAWRKRVWSRVRGRRPSGPERGRNRARIPRVETLEDRVLFNMAPIAVPDAYAVQQDSTLNVAAPGVLANDVDDNPAVSASLVTDASYGTVFLASDGSFTYTPFFNHVGQDSFTYQAVDSHFALSQPISVTIAVYPAVSPPPPVPVNDFYSIEQDQTLTVAVPGYLTNDVNPGSPILTSGTYHGELTFDINGSFTYTPNPYFSGTDRFVYAFTEASSHTPHVPDEATVTFLVRPKIVAPDPNVDTEVTIAATVPNAELFTITGLFNVERRPKPGEFTVTRRGPTDKPLVVEYAVELGGLGSGTPDVEYEPLPGVVVIPVGSSSATITVTQKPNASSIETHWVSVWLKPSADYNLVHGQTNASVSLMDRSNVSNADRGIRVDAIDSRAGPGDPGVFSISRYDILDFDLGTDNVYNPDRPPLKVLYAAGGTAVPGVDYVPLSGVAVIPAGESHVAVPVIPLTDAIHRGNKTVTLSLLTDSYLVDSVAANTPYDLMPFDYRRQPYKIWLPASASVVIGPELISPDAARADQASASGPGYDLPLLSGEARTSHALPTNNPGTPPLRLTYSSLAADPRPVFELLYKRGRLQNELQDVLANRASARLTLNGVTGPEVFYDVTSLNPGSTFLSIYGYDEDGFSATTSYFYAPFVDHPGDVMAMAVQADATGLPTGRYAYSIDVTDHYPTAVAGVSEPLTSTRSGEVTVINSANSIFGAGWSLAGLHRLRPVWPVTPSPAVGDLGAVLELEAGQSLWFAPGATSGTYVTPAGDHSSLVRNPNWTYTRTLKDGTQVHFDGLGRQASVVDRNGNTTAYAYAGTTDQLTTITDANGQVTSFAYTGGKVTGITDPAGRVTVLTYDATGTKLASITDSDPDGAAPLASPATGYAYDPDGKLTTITDPLTHATTFTYNPSGRVATVTRPDTSTEHLAAAQLQGIPAAGTGTSANPAIPVVLADGQPLAVRTDPRGYDWKTQLDTGGFGLPMKTIDPPTGAGQAVTTYIRDADGNPVIVTDPLDRWTSNVYDFGRRGDVIKTYLPDYNASPGEHPLSKYAYEYNEFSQSVSEVEPGGAETKYEYDAKGNLTKLMLPDEDANVANNPTHTFTYDTEGNKLTETDPLGNTTSYTYDAFDRLTQAQYPDPVNGNPSVYFSYDSAGNQVTRTDERAFTTSFVYDKLNRLIQTVYPLSGSPHSDATYDAAGNLVTMSDETGNTTSYTYDLMNRMLTLTDPLLKTTTYGYDAAGNQTSVTEPDGRVTEMTYDPYGRELEFAAPSSTPGQQEITSYEYDAAGQKISETDPLGGTTTYTYTLRGQIDSQTKSEAGSSTAETTQMTYDAAGNPTGVQPPSGSPYLFTFDAQHRVESVTNPQDQSSSSVFDIGGNLISSTDVQGNVTNFVFDSRHRQTSITRPDPSGVGLQTTTFGFDAAGNVVTTSGATGTQHAAFDAVGRQTSYTDANGNITTYTYDNAGRLLTTTDPLGHTTTRSYDARGRLATMIDRNGRKRTFTYNDAGRRTSEKWLDASNNVIRSLNYTYDAAGRLSSASDPDASYSYTYDVLGHLTGEDNQGSPGIPHVALAYSYTGADLTSRTDNLNGTTAYGYNILGQLTSETLTVSGTLAASVSFEYDSFNRLDSITRTGSDTEINVGQPNYAHRQLVTAMTYGIGAEAKLVAGITHTSVQTVYADWIPATTETQLSDFGYTYNSAGQLTTYVGPEGTLNYAVDSMGQLTGVSGARSETYSYDANGNRTMTGYAYDSGQNANRLKSDGTFDYTYDNEGNLLTKTRISDGQKWEFTWDYRNRLTTVQEKTAAAAVVLEVRFTYDVNDRRIGKWTDPDGAGPQAAVQTWTVYAGSNPYIDFDAAGTLTNRFVYGKGMDQLFARVGPSNVPVWYLTDAQGSVRLLVQTDGTVRDTLNYDSYGNLIGYTPNAYSDRFKFTGREWDAEIELQFNRARYYDPRTGRWIGEDPKGLAAGDGNLYRYVYNRPTSQIDPTGTTVGFVAAEDAEREKAEKDIDAGDTATANLLILVAQYFATLSVVFWRVVTEDARACPTLPPFLLPLDSRQRARGAVALISPWLAAHGHTIGREFTNRPRWWKLHRAQMIGFHRGHLIGKQLGGPGNSEFRNMVPQVGVINSGMMLQNENRVRAQAMTDPVVYTVIPYYTDSTKIPSVIALAVVGLDSGFSWGNVIPNPKIPGVPYP